MVGVDQGAALRAVSNARTRARLVEPGDQAELVFVHDRVREALLSDVGPDQPQSPAPRASLRSWISRATTELPAHPCIGCPPLRPGTGITPGGRCGRANMAAGLAALAEYRRGRRAGSWSMPMLRRRRACASDAAFESAFTPGLRCQWRAERGG